MSTLMNLCDAVRQIGATTDGLAVQLRVVSVGLGGSVGSVGRVAYVPGRPELEGATRECAAAFESAARACAQASLLLADSGRLAREYAARNCGWARVERIAMPADVAELMLASPSLSRELPPELLALAPAVELVGEIALPVSLLLNVRDAHHAWSDGKVGEASVCVASAGVAGASIIAAATGAGAPVTVALVVASFALRALRQVVAGANRAAAPRRPTFVSSAVGARAALPVASSPAARLRPLPRRTAA